jgi:hypothetical protein
VKNVLVISYYFPPLGMGSVLRPKFGEIFPRFNWHPIVLTSTPKTYYAKDEYLLGEV